jgi:hypothetical protein
MLLSLLVSHAFAQEPVPFDLSALLAGSGVQVGGPKAEMRWLVAEAASTRFPGEAEPGPTFAAGEMVEVIVVDGDKTRVRKGDRYGWVATASLTIDAPATATGGNPLLGGMPPLLPAGSVPPPAPK